MLEFPNRIKWGKLKNREGAKASEATLEEAACKMAAVLITERYRQRRFKWRWTEALVTLRNNRPSDFTG